MFFDRVLFPSEQPGTSQEVRTRSAPKNGADKLHFKLKFKASCGISEGRGRKSCKGKLFESSYKDLVM